MSDAQQVTIHPSANVSDRAVIGPGTKIWHEAQVREDAHIGKQCILGKGVYVDFGVHIGDHVKIQNRVSVYHGVTIEDGVFVGPHVCFTNDKIPRAITPDGRPKADSDWVLGHTTVRRGASIGAHSVILPDLVIGEFAMVGSGSVVTKSVPDCGLVAGNPARLIGFVCPCGYRLKLIERISTTVTMECTKCAKRRAIAASDYARLA
jgi:acetyltransferase-like isoleucine patch superfamily enzyme